MTKTLIKLALTFLVLPLVFLTSGVLKPQVAHAGVTDITSPISPLNPISPLSPIWNDDDENQDEDNQDDENQDYENQDNEDDTPSDGIHVLITLVVVSTIVSLVVYFIIAPSLRKR